MGTLKAKLISKIQQSLGKVPAREGSNGYVGDNPHEVQANQAPTTSTAKTQKKKTTGSTGSGVNIV